MDRPAGLGHLSRLGRTGACLGLLTCLAAPLAAAAQGAVSPASTAGPEAAASRAESLARARRATEQRDFALALPIFERLVREAPGDADLLIEAARVFGWADHNARAAQLYRQALAAAPQRRADIVPSLAWQTLWAGDDAGALPLFAEAAALRPHDRALGWAYAGALNAVGRHREALAVYQRWLPATSETERLDLARAWRWAGFEDRAWPLLSEAQGADARWLRDYRVARDVAPFGRAALDVAEDRDGLRSRSIALAGGLPPLARLGHAVLEFGTRHVELDEPARSATGTSIEAAARWRLGEVDAPLGTWWPQVALRAHDIGGWQPLNAAVRLKWIPADRWRVDAEHARELVETPLAFEQHVRVDVTSLGADWQPADRVALNGAVARLHFDDGTTRERLTARAEWTLRTRPRWAVGLEWSGFERTQEGRPGADARGYWNPKRYEEARLASRAEWDWGAWALQARLGYGRSREVDGAGNASRGTPHLWELALARDVTPSLQWRAAAGGSGQGLGLGSGAGSGAGYWRRWASLGITGWF
jgi:tetratricopeptide (TPR) repeat protein